MIYLYIKTHDITGLKYLGKTNKDPFKYKGSGIYWKSHLHKHGEYISTEIIYQSTNNEDIQSAGMYYSVFYDVVKSDKWANLIEENGIGGDTAKYINYHKRNMTNIKNATKEKNLLDIKNNKHPFQGIKGSIRSKFIQAKRLNEGSHILQGNGDFQRKYNKIRIDNGTHNFIQIYICPFCKKEGKGASMKRWHFNKCKLNDSI